MQRRVTKAIFPVAGMGTRFLPATKSVPKEIMTLVDRPLVQYAIDEARAAGITDFIFVTARGKGALEDYFDHAPELEAQLERAGKAELLAVLRATYMDSGAVAYLRQHRALGLGHAVRCASRLVGDEPFAVMLPDDVIAAETPCLQQMVEAHAETGGSVVAAMEVPSARAASYGILDVEPAGSTGGSTGAGGGQHGGPHGGQHGGALVRVRGMVEKPPRGTEPSNLAVIGRYVLAPEVMDNLQRIRPAAGGELQLTDAIALEIEQGRPVHGYRFRGERFDCGSKAGFLQATVAFGLARPDLRDELADYLDSLMAMRKAAQ